MEIHRVLFVHLPYRKLKFEKNIPKQSLWQKTEVYL